MAAHELVIQGTIKTIRRLIGDKLSSLPTAPNVTTKLPAVIRDRVKGVRPAYPFITVDLEASAEVTPWLKDTYYDEAKEAQVYINEQQIPLTIKCYGYGCVDILNEFRIRLDYDVDRWKLNEEAQAVFAYMDGVRDTPAFLSTDFVEAATMTMYFNAETIWSPEYEDAKNIKRVQAEGEFYSLKMSLVNLSEQALMNQKKILKTS